MPRIYGIRNSQRIEFALCRARLAMLMARSRPCVNADLRVRDGDVMKRSYVAVWRRYDERCERSSVAAGVVQDVAIRAPS